MSLLLSPLSFAYRQPLIFFQGACQLPDLPAPDQELLTEPQLMVIQGKRLIFAHLKIPG